MLEPGVPAQQGDSRSYVVLDLEWNGSYSHMAHGFFNEIIEIGAVKVDGAGTVRDRFHAVIKPVASRKLTALVREMTHISAEELEADGIPFAQAVRRLTAFMDGGEAVLMTWSTTDLLVLIENCRFFFQEERIPFLSRYADLQAYCQQRLGTGTAQQLGLGRACELVGIPDEGLDAHRALDDSLLTARLFAALYEPSFAQWIVETDAEFYRRLTFKTTYLSDIDHPLVQQSDMEFACEACGAPLRRKGDWRFRSRAFNAVFICDTCGKTYNGRIQYKLKYEGLDIRKRLTEKKAADEQTAAAEADPGPADD